MHVKKIVGILSFLVLVTIPIPMDATTRTTLEEQFPDPRLAEAISDHMGIDVDEDVSYEELQNYRGNSLNILNLSNRGIQDITGIDVFQNVAGLNLSRNTIQDVSSFEREWKQLRNLNLSNNNVSSIEPLVNGSFPELHTLHLNRNSIQDLSLLYDSSLSNIRLYTHENHRQRHVPSSSDIIEEGEGNASTIGLSLRLSQTEIELLQGQSRDITYTITNTGDVPLNISNAAFFREGQSVQGRLLDTSVANRTIHLEDEDGAFSVMTDQEVYIMPDIQPIHEALLPTASVHGRYTISSSLNTLLATYALTIAMKGEQQPD
ncbi:hypothetical protein DH09_00495 (plasmid) [Bacillaceae bacterium JMAK1]|nr:hypothetical protein DH09_00495 [Bacillaceae bacterium JMAK1]